LEEGAVMVEFAAKEEVLIVAYWALEFAMLVAPEVPSVNAMVNAPAVKSELVKDTIPAIAMSRYWVKPLLVISPQTPVSVPEVIIGKSKSVVRVIVI
jgi:hypothetical protein